MKPWVDSANDRVQSKSQWAREALDAWVLVCERAKGLGEEPRALALAALEDHVRVKAAVAELSSARSLSETERRLFRLLAPAVWARLEADK